MARHHIPISLFTLALCACGADDDDRLPPDAPPIDNPTTVAIAVAAEPGANVHVAYQDGDGPWQLATAAGNAFTAPIATGRYGVAVACVDDLWQELAVRYATVAEAPAQTIAVSCGFDDVTLLDKKLGGTVSGLVGAGYTARLGLPSVRDTRAGTTLTYSKDMLVGTWSLVFGRYAAGSAQQHVDRVVVRRDLEITGDRVENVDFATEGAATASHPVTVDNAGDDNVTVRARFRTTHSLDLTLTKDPAAPHTIDVPDATLWQTGDRETLAVEAVDRDDATAVREITSSFDAPSAIAKPFALALAAPLEGFTFEGAPSRFRARFTPHPTAAAYALSLSSDGVELPAGGTVFPLWSLDATPGYVAVRPEIATPDVAQLTALGLWDVRLDLPAGASLFWSLDASETRADGFTYTAARRDSFVP